jgi:hypothetical protein
MLVHSRLDVLICVKKYIIDAIERNLIQLKASENKRTDLYDFYCYQFLAQFSHGESTILSDCQF